MKVLTCVLVAVLLSVSVNDAAAQSKDTTIVWYGVPFYDTTVDGRVRLKTVRYTFDHIPTSAETAYVAKVNRVLYKRLPRVPKKKKS